MGAAAVRIDRILDAIAKLLKPYPEDVAASASMGPEQATHRSPRASAEPLINLDQLSHATTLFKVHSNERTSADDCNGFPTVKMKAKIIYSSLQNTV